MPKLDEIPERVQVVWFGKKWDKGCTPDIRIPVPEAEACAKDFFPIGERSTGAGVRKADGGWCFYHRDCYWELLQDSAAEDTVRDELDADPW